jgi:translation initiation factor 2 beta subunit (eIF-2beta)/eIF-5
MALPACVKCGSHRFEMVEHTPIGSSFRLMFVQCASCGGVVSVQDFFNLGEMLRKIGKKIGIELG